MKPCDADCQERNCRANTVLVQTGSPYVVIPEAAAVTTTETDSDSDSETVSATDTANADDAGHRTRLDRSSPFGSTLCTS